MPEIPTTKPRFFYTQDIKLAAALVTLGVPVHERTPTVPIEQDGKRIVRFCFDLTDAGLEWARAWSDRTRWAEFERAQPEHPLCYIRAAFTMRERYLDAVNQSATLEIKPHPRIAGATVLRTRPHA